MSGSNSTPGSGSPPRRVLCVKLGRELPGLAAKPFPNELGQRILDHVSQEAWGLWLEESKKIVNEYRLKLSTPEARQLLMEQCEKFFFGEGSVTPPEATPPGQP